MRQVKTSDVNDSHIALSYMNARSKIYFVIDIKLKAQWYGGGC